MIEIVTATGPYNPVKWIGSPDDIALLRHEWADEERFLRGRAQRVRAKAKRAELKAEEFKVKAETWRFLRQIGSARKGFIRRFIENLRAA